MQDRPNAGTVFTHADVQMERRILVGVVLDNRRSIWNLTQIGEDRDKGQEPRNIVEDKLETKVTDSGEALGDNAPIIERNFGQRETTGSGGFSSFGGRGDSSANTGTNTSLFSKATKDAPTDTTCSNTGLIGVIKEKQKDKITVPGFDMKKPSTFDEKQDHEVEDISAGTLGVVFAQDKKSKGKEEKNHQRQEEMEYHNWGPRDALPDSCGPARSASHLEHVVELYKVPKAGLSGHRSESFHGRLEMRHTTGAHHTTSPSGSHVASLSQSPASVYYSMASEIPIVGGIKPDYSEEDIRDMRQYTASAKGLGTRFSKSQGSPRDSKTVTPTVSWFLSIVPHESSVPALVVRPCSVDANSLRARAEETAKTLLLRWTNVDPEVVSGEDGLDGWNATSVSSSHPLGPAGDGENANQPCQVSSTPQIYPTYAPQRWYLPPVSTPPPPPNEKQSDIEELARLKKLILDEKAEQDMMAVAAAAAAAAAPPGALVAPMITEELPEDTLQRENTHIEAVDSMQMSQEYNVLWKAEPPRLPPVIMRDWLGRKFIFPVDMCQTWEVGNRTLTLLPDANLAQRGSVI